jgi:uncharacterized protein YjbI with pentapeptide repeats
MTNQPNTTNYPTSDSQAEVKTPLSAAQLLERYASGEKRFRQVQLKKADLKGASLALIDLRGADLSYANLREVDLGSADLKDACFNGADLYKANLSRANLQGAHLEKANLKEVNLTRASLDNAHLEGAFLTKACMSRANLQEVYLIGAHLNEADLSNANLSDAYLDGAYLIGSNLQKANLAEASLMNVLLSGANLSKANFDGGYYNDKTNFDASFDPALAGLRKVQKTRLEEILKTFVHLGECANRYMGSKMTVKYWESTRPDFVWLQQFQVSSSGQITFSGKTTEPLTFAQIKYSHKWVDKFIKSCSMVFQEFPTLLEPDIIEFFTPKQEF